MSRTASHKDLLGPLLFLLYTADLYKIAKRLGVKAYFCIRRRTYSPHQIHLSLPADIF